MRARDIMTKDVVTVGRSTPVAEIAAILVKHRISGVPVVTDDRLVIGIVSESDLMHRAETGTEIRRKYWLILFSDPDRMAREYTKAHGLRAEHVMSRTIVSVLEDAELGQVADVLDRHHIKRVPVLSDGKLVGLITRSDLVRALAGTQIGKSVTRSDDGALQKTLIEKIRAQPWLSPTHLNWLSPTYLTPVVNDGVVDLWGFIGSEEQRKALYVLIEEVGGVRKIRDHMNRFDEAA
jgi:CBS domain-containing protein